MSAPIALTAHSREYPPFFINATKDIETCIRAFGRESEPVGEPRGMMPIPPPSLKQLGYKCDHICDQYKVYGERATAIARYPKQMNA